MDFYRPQKIIEEINHTEFCSHRYWRQPRNRKGHRTSIGAEFSSLVLIARNEARLQETAQKAEPFGAESLVLPLDFREPASPEKIVNETLSRFGRIGAVVNIAGLCRNDMNQPMPHAVMPTLGGDCVNLGSFDGKVVLISFWTTWCPGCRGEMPDLITLQQKFGPQGFTVMAVSADDQEESVGTFAQTELFTVDGSPRAINFPVLSGTDETTRQLGYEGGLPASVLVSRDAKEMRIVRGPLNEQAVSKAVKRLL